MKLNKILSVAIGVFGLALTSHAQLGNDVFYPNRTYVMVTPTYSTTTNSTTCGPVDKINIVGRSVIDIPIYAANAGATFYLLPESSADGTNYTTITNFAYVTTSSYGITNLQYGSLGYNHTNLNTVLAPGTLTTPTAYSALFAGIPYLAPAQFTNSAAITVTGTGTYRLVFNASDVQRYISVLIWGSGSVNTQQVYSATLTGTAYNGGQL